MSSSSLRQPARRPTIFIAFLTVFGGVIFLALIAPYYGQLSETPLQVGDVAPRDVQAPYAHTYDSLVLTERQRDVAANGVAPVYTSLDTTVARRQLERLRAATAFINSVRADSFASTEQKMVDLAALEDINLSHDTAIKILGMNESRWQSVQQEAIVALEQVMRNPIRDDRLEEARRGVPAVISLALPEDQAEVVVNLVVPFVAPNSLYNEELTQSARQQARNSIVPVKRSFVAGETIIQRGQVVTAATIETLQEFGLVRPQRRWQDLVSAAALSLLVCAFYALSLNRYTSRAWDLRGLFIFAGLFLGFLLGARLVIPGHTIIPYVYPVMAFSLTVAALFGAELALLSVLPMAILVAFGLSNSLELTLFYSLSSVFGIFALGRARRITSFFWAALAITLSGSLVVAIYRLPEPTTDWIGIATLVGASFANGIASASLGVLLQFFLAQLMDMTTGLQLIELSRPDHPLLQFILRNAPGTYQHSLQLANLTEQAAERIGADNLLTRVGALYHDAGKALNPIFFIENQLPGNLNPHDDLDAISSATTIIRHISDGVELARKYRLPRRIQDFIREHHGTMFTRYQYVKAIEAANGDENQVDIEQFRYPGPRPCSKETGLLMLADGCEARVRAERPKDEAELRAVVESVIDTCLRMGELNDTDLTIKELDIIAESFIATLRGVYHPRLQYPKLEKTGAPLVESPPEPPKLPITTGEEAPKTIEDS